MSNKTVIGIDLGGSNVRVGKVRDNKLIEYFTQPISRRATQDVVLGEIKKTIDQAFDTNVEGIGIGVPSLVDVDKGIVYAVANIPSWKKVPLKEKLEKVYGVPVYINNDANCFALGEHYFGKARKYQNVVALSLGTGLGTGIIINNRLYSGNNCGAGEFGHIPYKDNELEYYCGGRRFHREYGVSGEVLYERALKRDKKALRIFWAFGLDLGNAIQAIMYTVDPEIIVFGGSVSKAYPFFEKGMKETLKSFRYQHALKRLVFAQSEMKEIPILGAAALCFGP